jgi:hypothetical protein
MAIPYGHGCTEAQRYGGTMRGPLWQGNNNDDTVAVFGWVFCCAGSHLK